MFKAALRGTLKIVKGKKIVKGGLYVVDILPPSKKKKLLLLPRDCPGEAQVQSLGNA